MYFFFKAKSAMAFRNGSSVGKGRNGHATSNGTNGHAPSNGSGVLGNSKRVRFEVVDAPET